jgi:RNA recognition motif-containing protein
MCCGQTKRAIKLKLQATVGRGTSTAVVANGNPRHRHHDLRIKQYPIGHDVANSKSSNNKTQINFEKATTPSLQSNGKYIEVLNLPKTTDPAKLIEFLSKSVVSTEVNNPEKSIRNCLVYNQRAFVGFRSNLDALKALEFDGSVIYEGCRLYFRQPKRFLVPLKKMAVGNCRTKFTPSKLLNG